MEVAHVRQQEREFAAVGTQLGAVYELRYRLERKSLALELIGTGAAEVEIELGEADFFDLAWSPLLNSLPVLRDGLLTAGAPRDYVMRWVDVPAREGSLSQQ